ncbi:uncharacterized protein LOC117643631 isoform X2 [Thrips palmi]|uniref:Uncharacterized protein LOC117643631 isoform X2 n=1 Tax=Thrips palmi TaxID=161013 RepID=A0A6P8YFL6_THRPL|nr:uncharacterized protein LOC117643631 isoform X2 [Thrips palmi]
MIQAAIKIGAECGLVKAAEIVPCANTVTTVVKALADKGRAYLVEKLREDVEDGLASGSVDGWDGGGLRKRKFYCQTLSTINEDFELNDHVLFTTHCDAEKVTSAVIREAIDSNFARLQLPGEKVHEVTDDGADIVAALADRSRDYCMDHALHLTVKKSLTPILTKIDLYGSVGGTVVEAVTRGVQVLKSSRQRPLTGLKKKLQPPPRTHRLSQRIFKSCLPMLKSVKANFNAVKKALELLGHGDILASISCKDLQDLISVVEPIEKLGTRKGKEFHASHLKKVVTLTTHAQTDSQLKSTVKAHIHTLLVPILKILNLIKKCKDVANFIKNSGANERLVGGTLKQEVDTRWMSVLTMMRSFFIWPDDENTQDPPSLAKVIQVNEILSSKDKAILALTEEETTLMLHIIELLRPIQSAIKVLEASKVPTIHHVIPRFTTLRKHLQPKQEDSQDIMVFRATLLKELERKVAPNISLRHKMGLFFWPKFASLPNMSEHEKTEVLAEVRRLCEVQAACIARRKGVTVTATGADQPSPSKRRRRIRRKDSDDEYDSLVPDDQEQQQIADEVGQYLLMQDVTVRSSNVLQWWKAKAPIFPQLSRVARMILATSAASAPVERVFSHAGNLISPKKTCLASETVDDYLFLNDFIRKFGLDVLLLDDE